MKENMTVQQAINIVAEEAVRKRRLAQDLLEPPTDEKSIRNANDLKEKAEAMEKLVKIARLWVRTTDE